MGAVIESGSGEGIVAVRLTEVEAYAGLADPASHAYRGSTPRTAVMFGRPGVLYVYFSYGMHWCANVVCERDGVAAAVLLRAGEVVRGAELAAQRRPAARRDVDLARGPARLAAALGLSGADSGVDLLAADAPIRLLRPGVSTDPATAADPRSKGGGSDTECCATSRHHPVPYGRAAVIRCGPRVGISRAGDRPWRFFYADDPSVSTFRAGGRARKPVQPPDVDQADWQP